MSSGSSDPVTTPLYANDVATTLAVPVADGTVTAFTLTSATGWPVPAAGEHVPAVVVDTSTSPETVKEYVWVTALSGVTATVTRQAEDAARFPKGPLTAGLTLAAVATAGALAAPSPWTLTTVSTVQADWTLGTGGGTWVFSGGVISQTDPTATDAIFLTAPQPATEFIIEAQVRVAAGQNAGVTPLAVVSAGDVNPDESAQPWAPSASIGEGFVVQRDGLGDGASHVGITVDGSIGNLVGTAAQNTWVTVRAVLTPVRQLLYLNGAYTVPSERVTGGNVGPPNGGAPDKVFIGVTGAFDFRALKLWTPTLP